MSWTTITTGTSWQSLAIAQEIAAAYNLRAFVAGAPTLETSLGVSSIVEGLKVFDFVSACQTGIESMALSFANPGATLAGQSSIVSSFASVQAMLNAAGLSRSGGWRRIAEGWSSPDPWTSYFDQTWNYGKISDKDLAGPWLFKDLQLSLSAMKRIVLPLSIVSASSKYQTNSKSADRVTDPLWNSDCDTLSGSVNWPNTGNYGSNLLSGSKRLEEIYNPQTGVFWRSTVSAVATSKVYAATSIGFDASVDENHPQAASNWSFVALLNGGSYAYPFTPITGIQNNELGLTKNFGDNGSFMLGSNPSVPAIFVPINWNFSSPAWQSLINDVPTPPDTSSIETRSHILSFDDFKLVMDFVWSN